MPRPASSPVKLLIAANLDRAIKEADKTNREIGESVGVTEHAVWRWRNGRTEPSSRYIAALADVLFEGDIAALYAPTEAAA
jgi:transcriptional regulator with XRE-family HTH domain